MSRRLEMVSSVIREVISDAIQHRLSDPRISPFTSVTRVEVSGDLQVANVYISVMGTETEQRKCLRGLLHARGHVQTILARRIRSRHCPRLEFALDPSIKKTTETIRVIDEAMTDQTDAELLTDTSSDEIPRDHDTQDSDIQGPFADISEDREPSGQADGSETRTRLTPRESEHPSEGSSKDSGACI